MAGCAYDGRATVSVKVVVYHSQESTGTAYNVTVNIYLPDYVTMKSKMYTQPRENTITVLQSGTVITAEIARLTFSDPFSLDATLTLDLSDPNVLEATYRTISAETIYNDRWGNITDLMSTPVYLSLNANDICAKRLTWTTATTCNCTHKPGTFTCGCCVAGACQCGAPRPQACAPCNEMWRCIAYKREFEYVSSLTSLNILCDAFQMRRGSATGVSCQRTIATNPNKYLEISPRVSVITGSDPSTGYLYGVANNGLAYVFSDDQGATWTSLADDDYAAVTSGNFTWAEFSKGF
ncbi:uncharacterized protein LOC131955654 [Physella acuta]|uniref:uncharacterized protein LOC131955654 n=1 Tax=Physella acuta TaxID=109671 RepID=UPI0027DBD80D|nr:uncharacterized protein LOC131955654 [Physella acuta]